MIDGTKSDNKISSQVIYKSFRSEYESVIDNFLRNYSILNYRSLQMEEISTAISNSLSHIPNFYISRAIDCFLAQMNNYHRLEQPKWQPDRAQRVRNIAKLLQKINTFAPVYDLNRSLVNADILQEVLSACNLYLQLSTQISLIIFITDLKSQMQDDIKPLIQKNIQEITQCSPYAFHRSRNLIEKKFPHIFKVV